MWSITAPFYTWEAKAQVCYSEFALGVQSEKQSNIPEYLMFDTNLSATDTCCIR